MLQAELRGRILSKSSWKSNKGIRKNLASTFKKLYPSSHHSVLISRQGETDRLSEFQQKSDWRKVDRRDKGENSKFGFDLQTGEYKQK